MKGGTTTRGGEEEGYDDLRALQVPFTTAKRTAHDESAEAELHQQLTIQQLPRRGQIPQAAVRR